MFADKARAWRAGTDLCWIQSDLDLVALEIVSFAVESSAPVAYLIVHLDLLLGARSGVSSAMGRLSDLVRLQSKACHDLTQQLGLSELIEIDELFLRAVHLFGVTPGQAPPPPRVRDADATLAWLVAGVDLPADRETQYVPGPRDSVHASPGLQLLSSSAGVALAADRPGTLRDRDFRAHCLDALLMAVVQRDSLLRISAQLAGTDSTGKMLRRPEVLGHFSTFRHVWWQPAAVDHPLVRAIGDAWRNEAGVDRLFDDIARSVTDVHAEVRSRRSEMLAVVSLGVAVVAVVLTVVLNLVLA